MPEENEPSEELLLDDPIIDEPDDELSIEIEGDDHQEEPDFVKTLRKRERDLARENAELKRSQQAASAPTDPGKEPELDDFDWDQDRFKAAWKGWNDQKVEVERYKREQESAAQARNHTFERSMSNYRDQVAKLRVNGFAEAEQAVKDALPEAVQSAIPMYMKEPAKLVAALGKRPELLSSIAAEPDPLKQILMLKDIEGKIKTVRKNPPPPPESETIQRGSAAIKPRVDDDKKLAELEKEADRTGNRDKIIAYKAAMKERAKK